MARSLDSYFSWSSVAVEVLTNNHRSRRAWLTLLAGGAMLAALGHGIASAQSAAPTAPDERPKAELLSTAGAPEAGPAGDNALDSVIHAALEKLAVVNVVSRPGVDLGAIQLALDCVGETPECLRAVATQSGVQIVIAPALAHTDQEIVLTLLYFDATGGGEMRRVAHRQPGNKVEPPTLDAVPGMLRELFQVATPAEAPAPAPGEEGREAPPPSRGVPVGPLIVGGAGVAIVGVGIAFGLMMQSTQTDYSKLTVKNTTMSLNAANDKVTTGKTDATVANVLYGVGAVAIAAGCVWLALALTQHKEEPGAPQTAMLPLLSPGQLGLALVHRGGTL